MDDRVTRLLASRINGQAPQTMFQAKVIGCQQNTASIEVGGITYTAVPRLTSSELYAANTSVWVMDFGGGQWLIIGGTGGTHPGNRYEMINFTDSLGDKVVLYGSGVPYVATGGTYAVGIAGNTLYLNSAGTNIDLRFNGTVKGQFTTAGLYLMGNAGGDIAIGNVWSGDANWKGVVGNAGYLLLGHPGGVNTAIYLRSAGTGAVNLGVNGANNFVIGSGKSTVYNSSGNLSIGQWTTNPAWNGVEGANGYLLVGDGGSHAYLRTKSTNNLYLGVNDTNVMTIRGTDGLAQFSSYIQDTNQPATATLTGYQYVVINTTSFILHRFTSQRAMKDRIETLRDPGEIIDKLRPVTFIEKATDEDELPDVKKWREADEQVGFIAEEVWDVDPRLSACDVVDGELVPNTWNVHPMLSVVVAELQSLRARVATLEGIIERMETE